MTSCYRPKIKPHKYEWKQNILGREDDSRLRKKTTNDKKRIFDFLCDWESKQKHAEQPYQDTS